MKPKTPTLYDAVARFMGPLMAEYARLIEDYDPELEVVIKLGGYEHKTTLGAIQDMDRAYHAAFEAKCKRDARKYKGTLL